MKKSVAILSGAALALLLSAGQSLAGGASLTTTLTTSKTTIYQNETLTLDATLLGTGNSSSCVAGHQILYKDTAGATLCSKNFSGVQTGPFDWEYTAEQCAVNGSDLLVGSNNLKAEVAGGYCGNVPGQTADQVQVTVLAGNAPAAVPTTSEWTLWGLTGLLLIGGGVFASRRFRATAA